MQLNLTFTRHIRLTIHITCYFGPKFQKCENRMAVLRDTISCNATRRRLCARAIRVFSAIVITVLFVKWLSSNELRAQNGVDGELNKSASGDFMSNSFATQKPLSSEGVLNEYRASRSPSEVSYELWESDGTLSAQEMSSDGKTNGAVVESISGYEKGFIIAGAHPSASDYSSFPFLLRLNAWGQLRTSHFFSDGDGPDLNQFQLARARIIFSGHAYSPDFRYDFQIDGRSASGDDIRLLDYYMSIDLGHHFWSFDRGRFGFRAGKYKMPFSLSRWLSGQEFEFADRSVASTYFDVNRSLAWGLYGEHSRFERPLHWELAIFNGLVTGGAETGSSGDLDNNFATSGRIYFFPNGDWGDSQLADLEYHTEPATRIGMGAACSNIERTGNTEFNAIRVVDSGQSLGQILPLAVDEYFVAQFAVDASLKYRGMSLTNEYYFRSISGFNIASVPDLFDHGFWIQTGYFVLPCKLELVARWSCVMGDSGTLGIAQASADEKAVGAVWYFRGQHAKFTFDAVNLNGAPINSPALNIFPGDSGWQFRNQLQFSF
jgi:hypothetical protein